MAAVDKLGIWNLSLSHLSQAAINSIGDGSIQDVEITKVWDYALRDTLAGYNWGFAKVQEALTVVASTTFDPVNYTYAYIYPTNCLKIRKVNDQTSLDKNTSGLYEIMLDVTNDLQRIVTDIEDAYIEYTYYIKTVTLFSHHFITAVSHKVAAYAAVPLNGDKDMAKDQGALFNNAISEAHRHEAGERFENREANEKSAFVDARE